MKFRNLRSTTSEEGRGPSFRLTADFKEDETPADRCEVGVKQKSAVEGAASLRILLVEDNKVNQLMAQTIIKKRGHKVISAMNGLVALELLAQHAFDVIFMDVQMPEMDGITATRLIRLCESEEGAGSNEPRDLLQKLHVRIKSSCHPIIAMTAHAMSGDREKFLEAGMSDYITKPFHPEVVFAALERVASDHQTR